MKMVSRVLFFLILITSSHAAPAADHGFTLNEYRESEAGESDNLDLILEAMYQTAVYAQAAIEHPAICFTPIPISGANLRSMIAAELTNPDNPLGRAYSGEDPVALVLVNALKAENVCR